MSKRTQEDQKLILKGRDLSSIRQLSSGARREIARIQRAVAVASFAIAQIVAASPLSPSAVRGQRDEHSIVDERKGENWLSYGRTYSEQFFSPLTGISDANVKELGLAWFVDLPGERTLEGTPLAVNGVLYFSGTHGKVYAIDARNGRQLWMFDGQPAKARSDAFRFSGSAGGNRGVAYWQGKVYVGTVDGRLFSLDARSGQVVWSVQTLEDSSPRITISGAPRVFNGKVVIGNCGEFRSRGYLTAYDAQTGRQLWRFYTVPGDPAKGFENPAMAMASKTWRGRWWEAGGNGSVWDGIAYDPDFNRVYFGTANWLPEDSTLGTSKWVQSKSAAPADSNGDHLFTSSIVALDADTGEYAWHYQENPGGDRDYDSTMPLLLAKLRMRGLDRNVLMHAPKNGFFYILDRSNGELISAEKITKVTWADRIDGRSGRPVETRNAREVWPSFIGAHSWQPMSFSRATRLVYIPTMKLSMTLTRIDPDDATGALLAWDPVAQKKRWEVRYTDSLWNGGAMSTAGNLVFHGTGRGQLVGYKASSGEKIWSFDAGLGIVGTPISYEVDGIQHISILVGYGGSTSGILSKLADYGWRYNEQPRRLLTFALGKHAQLPPSSPPRYRVRAVDDPSLVIDANQAKLGSKVYHSGAALCSICHGRQLENTGSFAPDLRESALAMNWEAFKVVVHDGVLAGAGMPKFDTMGEKEMRAIYMYIRQRAREASQTSP